MATIENEKPKYSKATHITNIRYPYANTWDKHNSYVEFEVANIQTSMANAIRRLMISDVKTIQPIVENYYTSKNRNPRYYRYVKAGIGYAEGWAPSAICQKYNIPIEEIEWRKSNINLI